MDSKCTKIDMIKKNSTIPKAATLKQLTGWRDEAAESGTGRPPFPLTSTILLPPPPPTPDKAEIFKEMI